MMEYKIIEMPAFSFAGVSKRLPLQFVGVNNAIVQLAESITQKQKDEMHQLQNLEPYEILNISYESDTQFMKEEGELTHMIGILTTSENISDQLQVKKMPACTWAVFPNEGPFPETYQNTMAQIYAEWLSSCDYELAESLSFSFTKMNHEKQNIAYSEIWIPVKKKI